MSDEEVIEIDPPETPRLTAWYNGTRSDRSDRPSVHVWYPQSPPTARLAVISHGCNPDTLPTGPLHAYFTIGGCEFGGLLDDMEWLLDAAREAVTLVRWQAERLAAGAVTEEHPT